MDGGRSVVLCDFRSKALTLLNTVLLGTLEVLTLLLLAGDALDALVVVVLVRGADSGVGALCTVD
jgi:hypothetical protein